MEKPPVCKIMDYTKFRYKQKKRIKEARKFERIHSLKEVRMGPKISSHDLETKSKQIHKFIEKGHKVKITIRFRGREMAHLDLGRVILSQVKDRFSEMSTCIQDIRMEGRRMHMFLVPKK